MSINTGMFPDTIITNAGKQMIVESQNGATLKFTRVALGDGVLGDNEDELELTALKNEKLSVNISSFKDLGTGQFTLTFTIDNSQVEKGFWHREIGIMASVDGGTEKLYAYTNAGSAASFLYDKTTPVQARTVKIDFVVGSAENVEVVVDKSIVYATQNDLFEHDADENAHAALLNKINNSLVKENNLYHAESTGYGIVSGCEPSISGLTVKVGAGVVHLADGTRKEIVQTNITLDNADQTNQRIDLVYINADGEVAKVTGTAAASPSVPAVPTGGISVCNVTIAAGATTGTVTAKRDILPRFYNTGIVNVKDFGAKGDGVTDDTAAIQAAIDHGGLVIMPEGIYRISEGLIVNVNKTTFRGVSSRAIITPLSTFPDGGTLITFCKTVNNDYLGRKYRAQTHGNFSLIGTMNDFPSTIPNVTAMKVAGDVGSTYEGHTDCQQYENIVFGWVRDGLNYGSHNYKCIFRNLIFNNGISRYSLFSDSQQVDSGEANMCECCSFWGGRLKLKTSMNFISCTIHVRQAPNDDEPYGHGFFNGMYNLTDCHIEDLHGADAGTIIFKNAFYAQGATVNFTDCEFIGSASGAYIDNAFFYAPWSTDNPTQINVTGAYGKWLFGKLKRKNDDKESTLCKGNVRIDKTSWGFDWSDASPISIPIWGETPFKTLDGYVKLGGLESATITTTDNVDGSINVNVTNASGSLYRMLAKKISVSTQTAIRLSMKIILHTVGVQIQNQFKANTKGVYGLRFFGNGEEKKFQGVVEYYSQVTAVADGDIYETTITVPIPVGTEYILYGPAFNTNISAFNFDVVACYAELL